MNEVLNCLLTRRSVKKYLPQPVEQEKLDAVLEAGTYAACGMGRQAGKIVVLQNPDDIAQLERMNAAILGNPDAHPFYGAPVVCVVFADTNVNTWIEDGSLVIGNMMAAAHSLGLGSCWIHRARQEFESAEGRNPQQTRNFPAGRCGHRPLRSSGQMPTSLHWTFAFRRRFKEKTAPLCQRGEAFYRSSRILFSSRIKLSMSLNWR